MNRDGMAGARLSALLPYLGLLLCAFVYLLDSTPLTAARHAYFDQLQRWHPRPADTSQVVVVDIDEQSLQRLGQWPWPRSRLAELLRRLARADAGVIGFDMAFSEPDRTSPEAMLELWPASDRLAELVRALPDHDRQFAEAVAEAKAVLGYPLQTLPRLPPPDKAGFTVAAGTAPDEDLFRFGGRLGSLPVLEQAARGLGHFSVIDGPDSIVRQVPLLVFAEGRRAPSLALEMLRLHLGVDAFRLETDASGRGLAAIGIGTLRIPTETNGLAWLHYQPRQASAYLPAWQLLDQSTTLPALQQRMVLVGSSASLLHDTRATPLGEQVPGVEVHRQLIEQMLDRDWLRRPGWLIGCEVIAMLAGSLLLIRFAHRWPAWPLALLLLALPIAALGFGRWLFASAGLIADPVSPLLAWATCLSLASLSRLYRSDRRQRWIRQAFSRYVSPNLVRHLVEQPDALELGGRRQECSFVFTDLEGFTGFIEKTPPRDAVGLINSYLDGMIAIVFRHEGTLVGIAGDGMIAMFAAPVYQPDHAARALACAIDLDRFAHDFANGHSTAAHRFCRTRIGVNSGEVTVGNFGGSTMLEYRALGDPVNSAARLEAANKVLGTRVCVSATTLAGCQGAPARPIGRLLLRGRQQPLTAFEPVAEPDPDYEQAFELLRHGNTKALARFEDLCRARTDDPLCAFHLARLRSGATGDLIDLAG
ncbi:MAG: adenylate/guanylate cyclase domain-containing protein [Rhodocyclaceae bacterium]|nr:adenylate/guanylate cyclase domain-containing protein [Rhodocyclaceae bacterium]